MVDAVPSSVNVWTAFALANLRKGDTLAAQHCFLTVFVLAITSMDF
jgi:hypothetical protein